MLILGLFYCLVPFLGYWPAFATGTMNPFSRLPVFLMGVYAGILSLRHPTGPLPWPNTWFGLPLCCTPCCPPQDAEEWAGVATWQSVYILFLFLSIAAGESALYLGTGGGTLNAGVWLQGWVAMTQLMILMAITRDWGLSLASKALRTPFALWLGKISMAVYLIHWPVIYYL